MSESTRDTITIIGAAVAALVLVSVLLALVYRARAFSEVTGDKVNNMTVAAEESDYTKYDGAIVTGSDVVSAIKYFEGMGEVCITVTTSKGTHSYIYTGPDLQTKSDISVSNTRKKTSEYYINPSSKFLGSVVRDADGTITNIVFEVQTN